MSNDECLINDEIRMTNDETELLLESKQPFRHSGFVIRHSLDIRH
jgi:hypothetical protein